MVNDCKSNHAGFAPHAIANRIVNANLTICNITLRDCGAHDMFAHYSPVAMFAHYSPVAVMQQFCERGSSRNMPFAKPSRSGTARPQKWTVLEGHALI
jgi:hypothetical protein